MFLSASFRVPFILRPRSPFLLKNGTEERNGTNTYNNNMGITYYYYVFIIAIFPSIWEIQNFFAIKFTHLNDWIKRMEK